MRLGATALGLAGLAGAIVLLVQLAQCAVDPVGAIAGEGECLKTPLVPFFCIWMAVWTTVQHESWKRKQNT